MDDVSLAELVLFALEEESGIVPDGELLGRIEKLPPASRRRLTRTDAEVFEICATAPLEMSTVLTGLLVDALTPQGRIDPEKAWNAVVAASKAPVEGSPDATAERLLAIAHTSLGLPGPCQQCADWQPEDADEDDDESLAAPGESDSGPRGPLDGDGDDEDEDHGHDGPTSLLERVYAVHADALDNWAAQVAYRIAAVAGDNVAGIAGFDVLHEVVGQRRRLDGVTDEQRGELHVAQHVGMSLCVDAAQVHGMRVAYGHLKEAASIAQAYDDAELASAEEAGVMAAVIASVVVDRVSPIVEESLQSAPPKGPPNRPARPRRNRRG